MSIISFPQLDTNTMHQIFSLLYNNLLLPADFFPGLACPVQFLFPDRNNNPGWESAKDGLCF